MSLELRNVTKSFGDKKIFNNFSYTFSDTGLYAIVGDSGIGKTTLLRLISGLDTKFQGEILGGGINNTSFLFQEYRLFTHLTALENAVIPNGKMTDKALLLRAKDLFRKLDFSTVDLSLLPTELSGGMKQRVAVVRALLKPTKILLLDEPTKELDSGILNTLYNIITEESKKRLVLMVTHREDDVEHLNPILVKI